MKRNSDKEQLSALAFARLGECYHLWTPENFELIFTCPDDFKSGMGIMAICAKIVPDITIITFELMSNHLHITAVGKETRLLEMFGLIKRMLRNLVLSKGRTVDWDKFKPGTRRLDTLEDIRNVIAYDNRNGYLVSPEHSPYTYPWGANKYFFNEDAKRLAQSGARRMTYAEKRKASHSHLGNSIKDILCFDGYALPLSFCDIALGESLFRDASQYFYKVSRNIESNKNIAREIGESVFYTDDELFSAISSISRKQYGEAAPSRLPVDSKIALARTMRFEYNSSTKQIYRLLKLDLNILTSLGL